MRRVQDALRCVLTLVLGSWHGRTKVSGVPEQARGSLSGAAQRESDAVSRFCRCGLCPCVWRCRCLQMIVMKVLLLESAQSPHPRTQVKPYEDLRLREERRLTFDPWCVSGVTVYLCVYAWTRSRVRQRDRW